MKLFIDIGHPSYYLALRHFIRILSAKGHTFFITARDKDVTAELLNHDGIVWKNRGKGSKTVPGKLYHLVHSEVKLLPEVRRFAPDLFLSFSSPVAAHLAFILRKPCITLEDTECAQWVIRSYRPFSTVILTPVSFRNRMGKKHLCFTSFKELGNLHPKRFNPMEGETVQNGFLPEMPFILLRFTGSGALHDRHQRVLYEHEKIQIVLHLIRYARIYISSEEILSRELSSYAISARAWEMHHIMARASLFFGESATMAAEAAVLGIPSIYIDDRGRGYTDELEHKYGLLFRYPKSSSGIEQALNMAGRLLENTDTLHLWQNRRQLMLKEKTDFTDFLIGFVEHFPQSFSVLKDGEKEEHYPATL